MNRPVGLATMSPAMEEAKNYNNWIYEAMRPYLGDRICEIGPGFGGIASRALADRKEYCAIDVDSDVILRLRLRLGLGADRSMIGNVSSFAKRIKAAGIDTIVMVNELEHEE